jgi:2-polyprenyl-3-methyl-5-hydroxy-6-metoxy-1,4-benzoquinol methylase
MNRNDKVFSLIKKTSFGLEIGPSYSPLAARKDGWNIEIADHLDTKGIREKYAAWGVDGNSIEDVDYVIGTDGLFAAIGEEKRFDFILASHVIEHVPDVIKFLDDCYRLLKFDGVLSLVVPDKKFCFDVLKPLSTTGQILQAHIDKRTRHSPGTIYDAHALHVSREDGRIVWPGQSDIEKIKFVHSATEAKNIMDNYFASSDYLDVHAWVFSPESFEFIINDLLEIRLTEFRIAKFFATEGHEFFVSLKKSGEQSLYKGCCRIDLAKDTFRS